MRPLKIALLSRWYWEETRRAPEEGGMVRQVAEAVAALGHEVVVLSQSPQTSAPLESTRIGSLEVWLAPRDRKRDFLTGLRDKWAKQTYRHRKVHTDALALLDFLARRGPFDVLWAHAEEPDGLVAAIAAQHGVALPPTLTQIHSLRYRFQEGTVDFAEKPALGLAFHQATRIIANSELVAQSLVHYAGPARSAAQLAAKTRVVFPNLTHNFLRVVEANPTTSPEVPRRVLFLGALNEKKGALVFLQALLKTGAISSDVTFAVAGGFTEKNPEFARRWEQNLGELRTRLPKNRLELLGKIPTAEVIRQIQRATVVVMPSLFDEFSRTLVESLLLRRPVITTDRVGASPLVADHACGLVVPAADAAALANAIDTTLNSDSPFAANAQRFGHRLLHEISPEAIALQLAQHLEETAALHRRP